MKKAIIILFFMVLAFRPTFYLGQMLYYQLNIDYIIETYCVNKDKPKLQCNGKCYLSQQLQMANPSKEQNDFNTTALLEVFYPVFLSQQFTYTLRSDSYLVPINKTLVLYVNHYAYLLGDSLLKPPITIV
ncbi:MAG: hypothetical protein R2781_07015 [Flavobacteriaceae bacterium]